MLGLLPSVASTIGYSLGYSGTGGALWGWLIAALIIQSTAFTMAELCSSMPTAGGLYYASAVLAPEGWGPLASWFVGWSNFCGFVTGPCSVNYALASMLITCGVIAYPDYTPETWHVYLTLLLLLIINGPGHYAVYLVYRLGEQNWNRMEYRCGYYFRYLVPCRLNQQSPKRTTVTLCGQNSLMALNGQSVGPRLWDFSPRYGRCLVMMRLFTYRRNAATPISQDLGPSS